MGIIECREMTARFESWTGTFSCSFEEGQWHVICGASGSGKSTLFQLMLGLIAPISGDLLIDGRSIIASPPHKRQMSFMTQYNILLPHLSVSENLHLAMHDSELRETDKSSRIREIISLLSLDISHLDRMPHELSGGQLSRCNLARCLLRPSRWLLLDEPFAAVDRPTRLSILDWLKKWQSRTGMGVLLVSHDLDDIFNVATHVTVVGPGKVIESQPLSDAINSPKTKTTASVLRSGAALKRHNSMIFVSSANLSLTPSIDGSENRFIDEIKIPDARSIHIGNAMRIIDLSSGIDITVPSHQGFQGSLWYDRRNAISLAES